MRQLLKTESTRENFKSSMRDRGKYWRNEEEKKDCE